MRYGMAWLAATSIDLDLSSSISPTLSIAEEEWQGCFISRSKTTSLVRVRLCPT